MTASSKRTQKLRAKHDGICIFDKKGRIILSERTPCMRPSNIAFGGKNLEDIYITSLEGHLYRVRNSGLKGNKLH